jgi:uncharacterized protein (DUF736 family)
MTAIGSFTKTGDDFTGSLQTLTVTATLHLIALDPGYPEGPNYRVKSVHDLDVGVAYSKHDQDGNPYISLAIDDPCFPSQLRATLWPPKQGVGPYILYWHR